MATATYEPLMPEGQIRTTLRPIRERIFIRQPKAAERSAGGIIIPYVARKKVREGLVVAVGPGRILKDGTLLECAVKPGDYVWFYPYGGIEIEKAVADGELGEKIAAAMHAYATRDVPLSEEILVIREDDILAVREVRGGR